MGPAVDCNSYTGSKVIGVAFDQNKQSILDCAKIENNVFTFNTAHPIELTGGGAANSDEIDNNYFLVSGLSSAVHVDGATHTLTIDHNLIAMNGSLGSPQGISILRSSNLVASGNVFLGAAGDPFVVFQLTIGTFSENYCDPENTGCASCVSAGRCATPTPPFTLP